MSQLNRCPKCGEAGFQHYVLLPEVKQGSRIGRCPRCGEVHHEGFSIFGRTEPPAEGMAEQHTTEPLRTLEEIHFTNEVQSEVISKNDLRTEAVKWVMDYRKQGKHTRGSEFYEKSKAIEGWIMGFFNLTEEDIKEARR